MILMAGLLPHPDTAVATMGIAINTSGARQPPPPPCQSWPCRLR